MAQQDAAELSVLVVDNGDARTAHAPWERFRETFSGRTEYAHVSEPGLSAARNEALRVASSVFVAFVDDDVTLPDDWHAALREGLDAPGLAAAGGPIRLEWEGSRPGWLIADHESIFSGLDLGPDELDCDVAFQRPYGANFTVHRQLALESGGFSTKLGRVRGNLLGGEDVDMIVRLGVHGRVRYLPRAWVTHHVDVTRMTRAWLMRRYFAQGKTTVLAQQAYARPARPSWAIRRRLSWIKRNPRTLPYRAARGLGVRVARREFRP